MAMCKQCEHANELRKIAHRRDLTGNVHRDPFAFAGIGGFQNSKKGLYKENIKTTASLFAHPNLDSIAQGHIQHKRKR